MKRLIRKILREEFNYKEKIFKLLQSGQDENIEMVKYLSEGQGYDLKELLVEYFQEYGPPYFNIFNILELTKEEQEYILSKIYGNITIKEEYVGHIIYYEEVNRLYDDKGNLIYQEHSNGNWWKREYDDRGNIIYEEHSDGIWEKKEYDDKGNRIYYENSDGWWEKSEYDDKGNLIYSEDSDGNITI